MTLKNKIKEFTDRQNERIQKEVEIELPFQKEEKIYKIGDGVLENNYQNKSSEIEIKSLNDKVILNLSPKIAQEQEEGEKASNLISDLNEKLEDKEEPESKEKFSLEMYEKTLDEQIKNLESPKSSFSPHTPKKKTNLAEETGNSSGSPKRISIKNIHPEQIIKNPAIEEIKIQSKWLESYLKQEESENLKNEDSIPSDVEAIHFGSEGKIIYDEDNLGKQTPEAVVDGPFSDQIKSQFEIMKVNNDTQKIKSQKSEDESDMDEIPVISYSDDEIPEENKAISLEEAKEVDSDGISDSEEEINIKNSDLVTTEAPVNIVKEESEIDKQSDMITNDLFYEILADIITEPVPRRDLSVFTLQPQD